MTIDEIKQHLAARQLDAAQSLEIAQEAIVMAGEPFARQRAREDAAKLEGRLEEIAGLLALIEGGEHAGEK